MPAPLLEYPSPTALLAELLACGMVRQSSDGAVLVRPDGTEFPIPTGGGGGGAPVQIVFAAYSVDAAVALGEVIDGSLLFVGNPLYNNFAGFGSLPPYPPLPPTGDALAGTWVALQAMPSATEYWGASPVYSICGYFIKDNAAAGPVNTITYHDAGTADYPITTDDFGILVEEGAGLQTLTLPAAPADGETHSLYLFMTALGGTLKIDANGKTIFFENAGPSTAAPFQALLYPSWGVGGLAVIYFAARDIWMITV